MVPLEDLRVYFGNLAAYNAGRLVGKWYSFPLDEEKIWEDFGEGAGEIIPMDFDGFPSALCSQLYSIQELNAIYQSLEELDPILLKNIEDLMEAGYDLEDLERIGTDFYYYEGCFNMADIAKIKLFEDYWKIDPFLVSFLDLELLGRYFADCGTYVLCSDGVLEIY